MNEKRFINRTTIIRLAAAFAAVAGLIAFGFLYKDKWNPNGDADPQKSEGTLFAMDTYMSFAAYGENADEAIEEAKQLIEECERKWSVTDAQSEIGKLNEGGFLEPSEETLELIKLALSYSKYTNSCFDPAIYPLVRAWGFTTGENRVPPQSEIDALLPYEDARNVILDGDTVRLQEGMSLDLGGIAKGRAGDEVLALFKSKGIKSALISLGGNVQMLGHKPDGNDWKIGIHSPYGNEIIAVVGVSDRCVITSGAYERYFTAEDGTVYGHIISPFDGYPVSNDLASVTVIAGSGALGDALSTALFVMGAESAIEFWKANQGFEIILLSKDGTLYVSEGILPSFEARTSSAVKSVCEIKR